MQKEYLSPRAEELSEKSDTELIDFIATEPSSINQETAKAILDKRTKKVLQNLTEMIQKNNRVMTALTIVLIIVAVLQVVILLKE